MEAERMTYLLERASRPAPARMHGVDAHLMFAVEFGFEMEDEAVALVRRVAFFRNVGPRLVGDSIGDEAPVHVELHLDRRARVGAVNDPAAHADAVGVVERAAEEWMEGDGVRVDGERGDEEQVERELRDDESRQTPARRVREGGGARGERNTETGPLAFGLRVRVFERRGVPH